MTALIVGLSFIAFVGFLAYLYWGEGRIAEVEEDFIPATYRFYKGVSGEWDDFAQSMTCECGHTSPSMKGFKLHVSRSHKMKLRR